MVSPFPLFWFTRLTARVAELTALIAVYRKLSPLDGEGVRRLFQDEGLIGPGEMSARSKGSQG